LKALVAALAVTAACASPLFSGTAPSGGSSPVPVAANGAPVVTINPLSQSVGTGGSLTFTAAASGSPTPSVQWQVSGNGGSTWKAVSGATTTTFTTGPLTAFEDGWKVQAVFTNSSGTAATNAATVTVTPATSVLKPSNGVTVSGLQALDAVASSGTSQLQYELTGGSLSDAVVATAASTPYGWAASWNTTYVPNGTYTLESVASYAAGGDGTSPGVTVTVNNAPPSTSVLIPANGTVESARVALNASASSNVTSVNFELTGGPDNDTAIASAALTLYGWLAPWNTTTVPNGAYTLRTVASYAGGVSGTSLPIAITVNNPPPTISIARPANGGATLSGTQWLDATASSGVTQVLYELTGGTLNQTLIGTATSTAYGWVASWNTTTVPNGTYSLQSVASYGGGVSGTSPPITITVNNLPTTALLVPSAGATVSGASALLDASASGPVAIASVTFEVSGGTLGNQVIATATSTLYGWTAQWNTTTVPNGTYSLQSVATDADNNMSTSAPITVIVDNAPSIFDDEFAGPTLSSAWTAVAGPGDPSNSEQECYSPQNVTVTGGVLQEMAEVGSVSNCYCPPQSTNSCGYVSGAVQWSSLSFTYGTVSVRAKLAGGQGTWPAIWLLGSDCQSPTWLQNNCSWPAPGSNEIDVAEILQSNLTAVNEQIHTENSSGTFESPGCTATTSDVSQNWHVYTLIWAPGSLTWEIDGVQTCQITSYVPTTPMFLIINTAVGGAGAGTVQNSTLPQTTEIDYVRVTSN
jgi:beta-glucanase (GH16 family)